MKRVICLVAIAVSGAALGGCASGGVHDPATDKDKILSYSRLWGRSGEVWLQAGRLPDFSYAGYRNGEKPIPDYPVSANVADFGARGDGHADDTEAFKSAIAKTDAGAIFVPPGRYIITGILKVTKPGVVLRGAGEGKSVLVFPKSLEDIAPNRGATTSGLATSNYAWSGGFVRLEGRFNSKPLTAIQGAAVRGDRVLVVEKTQDLSVGQSVEIFLSDTPENTLARHLYSEDAGDVSKLNGKHTVSLVTQIARIEGNRITLARRLRFDVRPEWKPVVRAFNPTVYDSGVEDLVFEFPPTPYLGHFTEVGFNPVAFEGAAHCWARRLTFVNPDSGPMVGGVFNTVSDVVFESSRPADKTGVQGHHGIYLQGIGDHLFTRFDYRMKFVHDISVSHCAGVVISQGKGVDLCLDHHKRAPYEILFSAINLGKGTRPWASGGGADLGKNAGARVTFWNLTAEGSLPQPPRNFAPWSINMVGVNLGQPELVDPTGIWREIDAIREVRPRDLHASQLARRLRGEE